MNETRSWMYDRWHRPPRSGLKLEYINGVDAFLTFACENTETPDKIRCPCSKCNIMRIINVEEVRLHLLKWGFMPRYYVWTSHGEDEEVIDYQNVRAETATHDQLDISANPFIDMVYDAAGPSFTIPGPGMVDEEPNPRDKEFFKLLESARKPLWPGSEDSVLSLTAKLINLKSKHNASQSFFNDNLDILLPNLPNSQYMPKNFYEAKKLIRALSLPHEKIDVCANGCMLFWKEDSSLVECKFCQHPRYKIKARPSSRQERNVPFRRFHYLPLIPRLQRLYASEENAKNMTWHAERSSEVGKMTHPSDSEAWKSSDSGLEISQKEPGHIPVSLNQLSLDTDIGDNVDTNSQPLSPTIPTGSSTKRPSTSRNGTISEGAQTHSRQSEPTFLRRPSAPTTGLRTPCLGDSSDNDNGDNMDITSQPLSPTMRIASSTKPPLTANGGHFIPRDKRPTNIIGKVIKKFFDGVWPRYSKVPADVRKKWWDDFKSHWYISKDDEDLVKSLFEKRTGERLREILHRARKCYKETRQIPNWIPGAVFEKLLDFWKIEKFIRSSDVNTSNRKQNSVDGVPVGTYNGGSRSSHDSKVILEKIFGRPVSLAEVFMCTHTNKKNKEPIDESAAIIEDLFKEKMPHFLPYLGQKDVIIPDDLLREADEVFLECVGGVKNGRVKGLGNLSMEYISGSIHHSMPNVVLTQQVSQLSEENSKLREDISVIRQNLEEERQRAAEERERMAEEREKSAATQSDMQKELERIATLV